MPADAVSGKGTAKAIAAFEFAPLSRLVSETEPGLLVEGCSREAANGRYSLAARCNGRPLYRSDADNGLAIYFWRGEEPGWWLGGDFGLAEGLHDRGSCFCRHLDDTAVEPPRDAWLVPVHGHLDESMRTVTCLPLKLEVVVTGLDGHELVALMLPVESTVRELRRRVLAEKKTVARPGRKLYFVFGEEVAEDARTLASLCVAKRTNIQMIATEREWTEKTYCRGPFASLTARAVDDPPAGTSELPWEFHMLRPRFHTLSPQWDGQTCPECEGGLQWVAGSAHSVDGAFRADATLYCKACHLQLFAMACDN